MLLVLRLSVMMQFKLLRHRSVLLILLKKGKNKTFGTGFKPTCSITFCAKSARSIHCSLLVIDNLCVVQLGTPVQIILLPKSPTKTRITLSLLMTEQADSGGFSLPRPLEKHWFGLHARRLPVFLLDINYPTYRRISIGISPVQSKSHLYSSEKQQQHTKTQGKCKHTYNIIMQIQKTRLSV